MVKEIIKMDEKDIKKILEKRVDEKTDMASNPNNAIDNESLINEKARTNIEDPKVAAILCASDITRKSYVEIFEVINKRRRYRPSDFKKQHFIPDLD